MASSGSGGNTNSLRRQPKAPQQPISAPQSRARASLMPSQPSAASAPRPGFKASASSLNATTNVTAAEPVCDGPLGRVPTGISHAQKMSMMDGIMDKFENGTSDYDEFLTLVELVCDPDNNTLGIFPTSEDSEEEEEGFEEELKAIIEEPAPVVVAKKLDFDEHNEVLLAEDSDLDEEDTPKCILQLREFRKANHQYWTLREQLKEREQESKRRPYLEALAALVQNIELEALPALNKAIKKPVAPADLAKSHGTTGIICPVEDQEELIQELTRFTALCEQFTKDDVKSFNMEKEAQFLAEKVSFLEKTVTDEAAERLQFQRLREYLKQLDEEVPPKSE